MKKITYLFILIINCQLSIINCKAQYVTIPDTNFVAWLTVYYPSCMSGNQMDTTCSGIVNATTLNIYYTTISNLSGIRYFENLTNLYCGNNHLTSLPILPTTLKKLYCNDNLITTLPNNLPNTLQDLRCNHNLIASVSTLPNSLQFFYCSYNQLTSLPALPNELLKLECQYNQLISIQSMQNSLKFLDCYSNQLTNLPTLSDSLEYLDCGNNQITQLPSLPNLLQNLRCYDNQLTSFPVLPNSLQYLLANDNQITNLPTLPASLQYLIVDNNQIASIPALPASLIELHCNNNQITSLPDLPTSLLQLWCRKNQLTNLPALPSSLLIFYCNSNQLTNIPTLPNNLIVLDCDSNQITSLPAVPNEMNTFVISNNNILCLVNLPQISNTFNVSIYNNPFTCVPNQTNYTGTFPLCVDNDNNNNPNNCAGANITGNIFTDLDFDCNYYNSDWPIENVPVKLYDNQNNFIALSYSVNGVYSFAALQPDTFIVKINDALLPITMDCGQLNNQSVILNSASQTILGIDFPVVCNNTYDININSVNSQDWVHPGQMHTLNTNLANDVMWYNLNCGNTTYSGTVTINVIGPVTYVAPVVGALTPSVSGNTFTYTIADFNSITPASFGLQLLTDTTAQAGQQVCVHVTIATTPADADTSNNEYDFCYNVVNSYDPNMKEVYPTDVLPGYNDWFTYTIHFQNTGTAPAFNIRLRDTLDTQLDLNTFEFLGASHTATTSLNSRNLSVRFNNIMLPDSTSNYQGSMGYYQYRVKPLPNLLNGSNIKNTAYIYFDYNPAIVTNTTENHFDMTVDNRVMARNEAISIYPNPSTGVFTFNTSTTIKSVEVFNVIGESVLQQSTGKNINISSQPKGVYFAKVNGEFVVKLLKE